MRSERIVRYLGWALLVMIGALIGASATLLFGPAVTPVHVADPGGPEPFPPPIADETAPPEPQPTPPPTPDGDPGWELMDDLARMPDQPNDEDVRQFQEKWPVGKLHELLATNKHTQIRHLAATALAYTGDRSSTDPLTKALHDEDEGVRERVNEARRRVFSRLGSPRANDLLTQANALMRRRRIRGAIDLLTRAIEDSPEFAEAFHKRATALYFLRRFGESARDYKRALELEPTHHQALTGLGRSMERMRQTREALEAYRKAQKIYPDLNLDEKIRRLEERLKTSEEDDPLLAAVVDHVGDLTA